MKAKIHPQNYRPVVFQDSNNDQTFITRSTVETDETITIDGQNYPLVRVHISSASHPFFTGEEKIVDVEGRVDKFKARRAAGQKAQAEAKAKAAKTPAKKPAVKSTKEKPAAQPKTDQAEAK